MTLTCAAALPPLSAQAVTGPGATARSRSFTARLVIGADDTMRACSAVLVDSQWLLTASSCFADDPNNPTALGAGAPKLVTTATIGRTDLTSTTGQVRKVTQLDPRTDRDLTLARLDRPVTGITPVAVATDAPVTGEELTIAGYGRIGGDGRGTVGTRSAMWPTIG
ncbi:hypothetical protein GCM10010358_38730 [Streptomyces minutiscleroticus]|uniref:Peptidase S1 domain-containing protein n=2 Tax=Streptomyces minutiscleroticus TaxID=68238 RepID=A0A918NMG0_9ACTN|nr:hypothetical protein GCM10010358_38730 [Streptomyces minutiscleroticus]